MQQLPRDMWLEVFSFLKPSLIISHWSILSKECHSFISSIPFKLSFKYKNSKFMDNEVIQNKLCDPLNLEFFEIELCDDEENDRNEGNLLKKAIDGLCSCSALKSIAKLNFSQICLDDELVEKIAQCENFANLQSLNLINSEIGVQSFKSLLASTFANSLKKLQFEEKHMQKADCEEIEKVLEERTGQLDLGVWFNELGEMMRATNPEFALELFKKAVDHNYYKATFRIGVMYDIGPFKGNGKEAMDWYLKGLKHGVDKVLVNLGVIYRDGIYVKKDISKTLEYYSMATQAGETKGMFYLSLLYFEGEGVEKDIDRAMKLIKKAASLGDESALCRLGEIYLDGELFDVNLEKAFKYFQKAAKRGSAKAMHHLGVMYRNGEYIEQDNETAFQYYLKAARRGYASAQLCVADCLENDKNNMEAAFEWYVKAAINGDERAAIYVGVLLSIGKKVPKNLPLALEFFLKAANNANAMFNVGQIYEIGDEAIPIDMTKAIEYYEKSAEMGSTRALSKLGVIYGNYTGYFNLEKAKEYLLKGSELGADYCILNLSELLYQMEDYENALMWLNKAIEAGTDFDAYGILGVWYREGKAVPQDYSKAIELFEKASNESEYAVEELAYMYRNGLGVEKNEEKAIELMKSIE